MIVKMGQEKSMIIDDCDYHLIKDHTWSYDGRYARSTRRTKRKYAHRLIMKANKGQMIDHINGDKLDNRRENLRFCSRHQNAANMQKMRGGSSKFKGVSFDKTTQNWRAKIGFHGKSLCAGRHETQTKAALAYNKKALELFGKFAHLNEVKNDDFTF